MLPINLYVDRMNAIEPVRVADVYAVTQNRATDYREAARKIGLTPNQYAEFRAALEDGAAIYGRLPRHIQAMAGIHPDGHVYALHGVVVALGTMGWTVNLADRTQVIVPQICSNLSMNRVRAISYVMRHRSVVRPLQRHMLATAARYTHQIPPSVPEVAVTFTPPAIAVAPQPPAAKMGPLPFFGILGPIAAAVSSVTAGVAPPIAPTVAPCSAGSNENGVCRR